MFILNISENLTSNTTFKRRYATIGQHSYTIIYKKGSTANIKKSPCIIFKRLKNK